MTSCIIFHLLLYHFLDVELIAITDVDIIHLSSAETRGTYVFEVHSSSANKRPGRKHGRSGHTDAVINGEHGRKALIFARQQLLAEVAKKDCNVLLLEGYVIFASNEVETQANFALTYLDN